MLKVLLVALVFFVVSEGALAFERPLVISGFDDVLRQANNTGFLNSAIKIFEEDKTFSGMAGLYTLISRRETTAEFFLVSAISTWFDGRIDRFLGGSRFPRQRRYLRNWLTERSIENFKISKIKEIIQDNPKRKFIVIFDNSDASLSLADQLPRLFPGKIEAIYLRYVVEKKLSLNVTSFFTAFDIALAEHKARRMTAEETASVGEAVLKEQNSQMLFPSYAFCPEKYDLCTEAAKDVGEICSKVRNRIESLCSNRRK